MNSVLSIQLLGLTLLSLSASAEIQQAALSSGGSYRSVAKHGIMRRESELARQESTRTQAVSWERCSGGSCKCNSRRRVVIRFQREQAHAALQTQSNTLTNWYYRSRGRPYVNTSIENFNKGFSVDANKLQMCGGDAAWSKVCLTEPTECTFDTEDSNPYDAKAGEYCCSGDYQYCSYKCVEDEEFNCPVTAVDMNFPGGMDPAGGDVYKRCYKAQYADGSNPEVATDATPDVDLVAMAAADKAAADKLAAEKAAADAAAKAVADDAANDAAAKAATDAAAKSADDAKVADDAAAADNTAAENAAADKAAADAAVGGSATTNTTVADDAGATTNTTVADDAGATTNTTAADKAAADKAAADKAAADKAAADQKTEEQESTDESSEEAADKAAADKLAEEKAAADAEAAAAIGDTAAEAKAAADKAAADKVIADDKAAADKAAADAAAADNTTGA